MTSKVSILIPCYNSEQWISETLQSALSQTWKNKEIIVVDDGSNDNSLSIAKQFQSSIVQIISQANKGASAARNKALKEAQGDYIQYLDADDLLSPDKIELQIKFVEQGYENYIIAGEWGRFYTSPLETEFKGESVWQDMSPIDWLVCSWKGGGMMHPAAWLISRNIVEQAGIWNEKLSLNDDGEYFCRVILASQGVKFCAGAKSYYRSGISGSLSGSKSRKAWQSAYLSVNLCTNSLLTKENSDRTRYASACYWQNFIFMAYPQASDLIKYAEKQIHNLGGCDLVPEGGLMFKVIRQILGWRIAMRLQKLYYQYR